MKTKIKFQTVGKISESTKENMWAIYKKYYSYSKAYFMQRIPNNTHFAFFNEGENMVGFTGLRINKIKVDGRKKLLLYFGQAVIEKGYRGKNFLRRMSILIGIKYLKDLIITDGYCWSDTISYKSYLFYAKSMKEYYPTYKTETPIKEEKVIYKIGETFYPDSFNPFSGTVRKEKNYVTDTSAHITNRHLSSPDIKFYATANPGHAKGHGLITIVPMSLGNLMHIMIKSITKKMKRNKLLPNNLRFLVPLRNYKTTLKELVMQLF